MNNWKKLGLIFKPDQSLDWMQSHAALPTPLYLKDDMYRIYFSSRDKNNYAHIGYFDFDIVKKSIIKKLNKPILSPGMLGSFDGQGVQATSINRIKNKLYLYYLGWQQGSPSPLFYTSIGLAISSDNGETFEKYATVPILDRSKYDPWMVSGGTVIQYNDKLLMYYLSGQYMEISDEKVVSSYDIKIAESEDGISWNRNGKTALSLQKNETNISRMSILGERNKFVAWYPVKKRNQGYRFGYAESRDGYIWTRKDNLVGIDVSSSGWDSAALDKVAVVEHKNKRFMFYNGNNFGYDGIGLAEWENE
ncbi:hypothetical protein DID74_00290 [Candidatus Marinamargulisbacteria bacterium SCGC AG-333-B06]|nr:hypothetical protein DID74_00290 [Candidatus Marinamargulisbacteria bacterium SCGC AG-333-B06]